MADVIHEGKKSFWSGKVKTLCGQEFSEDSQPEGGWFFKPSVNCRACIAAYEDGKRL